MRFNCTEQDIVEALNSSASSAVRPNGISFPMIKKIVSIFLYPLLILFQHTLAQGTFPLLWKRAYIIPLYKGKSERIVIASRRPISLCSYLGKLLEKIVKPQV